MCRVIRNGADSCQLLAFSIQKGSTACGASNEIPHPDWEHSGRALKGKRFNVQKKRQLWPGSEVLCRTSAFGKGSLVLSQ